MFLVVGLGNPGREHEKDRHNVGFVVVDALAERLGASAFKAKFQALLARGTLAGHDLALLKPQTYMNLSGGSVQPAAAFFKIGPADILVVHDEVDLPWGDLRLKVGGGHAGHNGVRNIIERLGTPDFVRLRVGVGKPQPGPRAETEPECAPGPTLPTRAWVLSGFDALQRAELQGVVNRAIEAIERVVTSGVAAAMNVVNTKI
jgi:PTH1 family peptidyl-tRNA hydrolase